MWRAVSAGIIVVASAGNGDENGIPVDTAGYMPAAMEECIVVGAVDSSHSIAPFSNYGESVDVCAPGVDIVSYSINEQGLESMSGTSMAAPMVTGTAAMIYSFRTDLSLADVKTAILSSAKPMESLAGKTVSGGMLDAYAALNYTK